VADEAVEWAQGAFAQALDRVRREGAIQAQGVQVTPEQLDLLLSAVPQSPEQPGRGELRKVDFRGATFTGQADFFNVAFADSVDFRNTTFTQDANFSDMTFPGDADFREAQFNQGAYFFGVEFAEEANFREAQFNQGAYFFGAEFTEGANFSEAQFNQDAHFLDATFYQTDFQGATFAQSVNFSGTAFTDFAVFSLATFAHDADFADTVVGEWIAFDNARFQRARELGPMLVLGYSSMAGAVFDQPVRIRLGAREAQFDRAVFRGGADIFVRRASVGLGGVDFAAPSLISEFSPPVQPAPESEEPPADAGHEAEIARGVLGFEEPPNDDHGWVSNTTGPVAARRPRVVSVRRAKVAQLTLSGVDLQACRFAGAHGLDRMHLEQVLFAQPPPGWQRRLPWRWTRRQTIAEEHHARHRETPGWYDPQTRPPSWLDETSTPPPPGQIAAVYRALRKSFEDNGDEPGAADFYYGEMEMRRRAAKAARTSGDTGRTISPGERQVLWLYWLLAGYGLRANRALIALTGVIVLAAVPLLLWGFHPPRGYGRAVLFAAQSSVSLLHPPEAHLSASGEAIEIVIRIAGPLFFGLAILSLRSRIKR
jgi:hypothetical protein